MENNTLTYSGSLQQWWNINGSYNRIQYFNSDELDNYESLYSLVQEWIQKLQESSSQTRLDIRVSISQYNIEFLEYLKRDFWDIDISFKKYSNNSYIQLIIGKNKNQRELPFETIEKIKLYVRQKVENAILEVEKKGWFENFALQQLSNLKKEWITFEKRDFQVEEVFNLWKDSFWWEKSAVEELISNQSKMSALYGLRNQLWELISLVFITDWETTEWVTKKEYQSKWYIEPLLIYANSNVISNFWENVELYVHARYNRSLSPAIKSWMNFQIDENRQFLLTNHVEIDGEYQTFVEGILDTSLYSSQLIESYLSFK